MTTTDTPGIISPETFTQYAANWLTVVGNEAELQQSFQSPTSLSKLLSVSFTMEQIQQLVSVVGAHYIMAKFLVTTDSPKFAIALYAGNAERARLSSYYISGSIGAEVGLPGDEVPDVLAEQWLNAWSGAPQVKRDMFTSSVEDAPLQGYTFDVNDFLALFYGLPQIKGESVLVHFGLHEYYRSTTEGDKLTQTFGLVLRTNGGEGSSDPFYDMSAPCPPIC